MEMRVRILIEDPAPPLGLQHAELASWGAYACTFSNWLSERVFLVGLNTASSLGRVTTDLVVYDLKRSIARTKSGRIYTLIGDPWLCSEGGEAFGYWVDINRPSSIRNVTGELLAGTSRWSASLDEQTRGRGHGLR